MGLGAFLIVTIISAICRGIIFYKRDIKWWKALVPGVNKYMLGKLVKSKKLAISNAIVQTIFWTYFIACFSFELWMMMKYSSQIQVPKNGASKSVI